MRRTDLVFLVLVLLMLSLAASSALAAQPKRGVGGAGFDTRSKGAPTDPNCWGRDGASQMAQTGMMGEHASSQKEPRLGVGNVARNDGGKGTRPSDHAPVVGATCQ